MAPMLLRIGFSLFSGLKDRELDAVAGMATRKTYPVNTVVYAPGDCTTDVLLLEDSNEAIQMEIPLKGESPHFVIHTLSKGEVFCWTPLCPAHARAATARVIQPASVIAVDGTALKKMVDEDQHAGYIIMKNLAGILSARLSYITLVFSHQIEKTRKKTVV